MKFFTQSLIRRFLAVLIPAQLIFTSVTAASGQTAGVIPPAVLKEQPALSGTPYEYLLNNGLKVILLQDKAYPFISCFSWYKVGSKDDPPGMTGLTHLVEHLLFQNIGSFKGDQLANAIVRCGGEFSGFTSEDFTTFYSNLPASQLDLAVRGEAERMRLAQFTKADVTEEIRYLVKEAQADEQDPNHMLNREIHALAYESHPYRNPPGGWLRELEQLTYEQAKIHYDRYFNPNNATLVLVGNFEKQDATKLIEKYFASIPKAANVPSDSYMQERPQLAERQIKLRIPVGKESVMIAYKVAGINDGDAPALAVLENLFNGQIRGRLRSKLSEPGVSIGAAFELKRDPGLFVIKCANIQANGASKYIQALDATVAQLKTKVLSEADIKQAVRQTEFAYYCDGDGPYHAAFQIGLFETLRSGRKSINWAEQIKKVTASDILRVAKRYLNDENRVLGQIAVAANGKQIGAAIDNEWGGHLRMAAYQRSGHNVNKLAEVTVKNYETPTTKSEKTNNQLSRSEHDKIWHKTLNNGMDILVVESHLQPIVELCGIIKSGVVFENADCRGVAKLTTAILNSGDSETAKQQQIAEQNDLGLSPQAMLKFDCGIENISFQTECSNKDLSLQMQRIFDSLAQPRLSGADFENIKNDLLINIRQSESQIDERVHRALLGGLIASNCAYYPVHPEEEISSITDLKLEDVSDFYRKNINPANTVLVICGDIEAKQVCNLAEQLSKNWASSASAGVKNSHTPELKLSDRNAYKSSMILPQLNYSRTVLGRIIPISNPAQAEKFWATMLIADCILSSHPIFSRLVEQFNEKPELLDNAAELPWTSNIDKLADKLIWSMQVNLLAKNSSPATVNAIQSELKQFSVSGITPREFSEARTYVEGNILIKECFNTEGLAHFVLRSFSELNEIEPISKIENLLSTMTYEDVNQFITQIFKPQLAAIVVAGPKDLIKQVHPERPQPTQD